MHDNLIHFLRERQEAFPFRRDIDLRHFLADAVDRAALFPVPAKIFLADEQQPKGYGFALAKSPVLDDVESKLQRWLDAQLATRGERSERAENLLGSYTDAVFKLSRNATESSILADYDAVFWHLHAQQVSRIFSRFGRGAIEADLSREDIDRLKYALHARWLTAIRESSGAHGFLELVLDNPLVATEEFVGPDLRELRGYFNGYLQRDYTAFRDAVQDIRQQAADLMAKDKVLRRSIRLLGYPDAPALHVVALLDPRVRQLLGDHPKFRTHGDHALVEAIARPLLEFWVVQALRRGIIWMKTTEEGENLADGGANVVYSRAIRPMNFGRRGVVEPIVYRYGLVYDITSFTETLGEIARGGKGEEQSSYRQMLSFQRELAEIARRHLLQFEKFLGDGAFYTSRRATRILQAAIDVQQFYAESRRNGFAFNKGMRIALNYGYYRLLPMRISADGTQIIEFYGPGIVELSRLTTGKTTKEVEDMQHLLLAHGYDQNDVYRFFAPLSRSVDRGGVEEQQREFFAYINENGHLINEGIVVSVPFLEQLSTEITEDAQKVYRLRTKWSVYLGFASNGGYAAIRLLGAVSLKGLGLQEIGEVVWLRPDEAEISVVDEAKPLLQLLQQERNHKAARNVAATSTLVESDAGLADLVVCEAHAETAEPVILVGEWDPVSEEIRRPIRLDGIDAERYGLAVPLTVQGVESQSLAYQKLYRRLSRIETLPSFSADVVRHNTNFSGFIIGATVEPL